MTMQVVAYIRANKKGEPQWSEDCVCQDPVYPSDPDGSDSDCVSMAVVREEDALAAIKAAQEDARRLDWIARQDLDDIVFGVVVDAPHDGEYVVNAGRGPFYGKTFRAAIDAAMGRLLGEDAGRGES